MATPTITPTAPVTPAPAPSASPAASPTAPASPQPASPTGDSAAAGSPPAAPTIDWNTAPKQLRDAYQSLKDKYKDFEGIENLSEVTTAHQTYQTIFTEAKGLAEKLGYNEEQVRVAMKNDPIKTITWLRGKIAGQPQDGNPPTRQGEEPTLEEMIEERLAPVNQFMHNQQKQVANNLYVGEINRLLGEEFKGDNSLPDEAIGFLRNLTTEFIKYDQPALDRLMQEGKVSDVAKYFAKAKDAFFSAHNALVKRGSRPAQAPGSPQAAAAAAPKKVSLDDIIEGNSAAEAALPSMRRK